MTINPAAVLARNALIYSERPAVSIGLEVFYDYRTLASRTARLAQGLRQRFGLQSGDRVAIIMKNEPAYFECLYGIWHAGLTAVPVNAKLHAREFAYILENSGARVVLTSPTLEADVLPLVAEIDSLEMVVSTGGVEYDELLTAGRMPVEQVEATDLAWLFYTSGTTGQPKGAMITHRSLNSCTMNFFADVDQIGPGDCIVHCAPLSHGSGIYALPFVAMGGNNIVPTSGGFDPAECFEMIGNWANASFFFAPTMVSRLVNAASAGAGRPDTSNLKSIYYGGGPMYVEDTIQALDVLGPKLVQIYGQGEAPMTITGLPKSMHTNSDHPRYLERLGSAGFARTDVAVKVVDADDNDLPVGEMGEIVCRGDIVMAGYWQNPEATTDALRGGWLHTGDVGAFDEDGFLTLKDRAKDMIISGGSNIYPREIEEVLLRHDNVFECSVVGKPHPDWGEEVIAFIAPQPGTEVTEDELNQLCLDNIARFKRPKRYIFTDALPKNNYGKILKTELRQQLEGEA